MTNSEEKYEKLKHDILEKGKNGAAIAYSGGVDSTTLAAVAHQILGTRAIAIIAKSPTYTSEELADAKKMAKNIGIKLFIVQTNELSNENFRRNPENRCYFCKKELLKQLAEFGEKRGFKVLFEGTNSSDLDDYRPGIEAIHEMSNVYSPWATNQYSKKEIRALAKKLGLAVHDKPALACLASRIPYHEEITVEKLQRIEKAERAIKKIVKIRQLRIRDHNGLARIEIGKNERQLVCDTELWNKIAKKLKKLGFTYVTLDLEGYRTGSLLNTLNQKKEHTQP